MCNNHVFLVPPSLLVGSIYVGLRQMVSRVPLFIKSSLIFKDLSHFPVFLFK